MRKVLVVEDNRLYRRFLEKFLPRLCSRCCFYFVASGEQALETLKFNKKIRCIISDYYLGENCITGIQLAKYVQQEHPHIKFILMSSTVPSKEELSQTRIHAFYSKSDNLHKLIKEFTS